MIIANVATGVAPSGAVEWINVWYHPNERNYATETPGCEKHFVEIPGTLGRDRRCVKEQVSSGFSVNPTQVMVGRCPQSHPSLRWWGFYPKEWLFHASIVVDQLKKEPNDVTVRVRNIGLEDVEFYFWYDCDA